MKRVEFLTCVKLARAPQFQAIPYLSEEMNVFSGCALDNARRSCTRVEFASLIVGHCATFGGTWLGSEEQELEKLSKRFDLVG